MSAGLSPAMRPAQPWAQLAYGDTGHSVRPSAGAAVVFDHDDEPITLGDPLAGKDENS